MTKVELYKLRPFVLIIHSLALVQFGYAVYYDYVHLKLPEQKIWPDIKILGKTKYLTYWCLIIQAVYFTVSVLNDLIGTNEVLPKKMPVIRKIKDFILASLAFPVALNVGVTFWSLMAIDRELVFPKILDPIFPGWLNHIMHTNIVVFIVLEMFISFRSYPTRSKGIKCLGSFMVAYLVWLHIVKYYSGFWVYPVLDVLNLPMRILFFVGILAFTLIMYLFGESLNNIIWTKEIKMVNRKSQ